MAKFIKIYATYEGNMYESYVNSDKINLIFVEGGYTKLNVDGLIYALYSDQTPQEILQMIDEQPTVDAVPVDFIQQRIDQLQDVADFALDSNGGYIESANSSLYELKLLLSRWKAEQSAKDK